MTALSDFFMYASLINGSLLLFWTGLLLLMPDFIYRLHSRWFQITRPQFDLLMYGFLGLFKIFFIIFNLTPYLTFMLLN